MRKGKMLQSIVLLLLVCFPFSCVTTKIALDGEQKRVKVSASLALIQVMITPPDYPLFPVMDARIYRSAADKKSKEITAIHESKIAAYTNYLGEKLSEDSGSNVLYGVNLTDSPAYRDLPLNGASVYSKKIDNSVYREIIMQEGYFNLFDFSDTKNPIYYFDKEIPNVPKSIRTICSTLAVETVAVCVMNVNTIDVAAFGSYGLKRFQMKLYFYDKEGEQILKSSVSGAPVKSAPEDLEKYEMILEDFFKHADSLSTEIYSN